MDISNSDKIKNSLLLSCFFLSLVVFLVYKLNDTETTTISGNISSDQLVLAYTTDEQKANYNYKDKQITITGSIKEINFINNRNTIVLYGNNDSSFILCDMGIKKLTDNLKINQKVNIRGICKGFLNDVILLNCTLIKNTNNE